MMEKSRPDEDGDDVVTVDAARTGVEEVVRSDGKTTDSGGKVCCSVLYAAYYPKRSPRDVHVLNSKLDATPAWLDLVREMNEDVLCDSIAWTDFALTTESAYPDPAVGRQIRNETSVENSDERRTRSLSEPGGARSHRTASPRRSNVGGNGEPVSELAKRVLKRYFYDEVCKRLATNHGVPTLTVFLDRLKRGARLDENDRNYRYYVDSMLSDLRFVAALEVTRPPARESPPQPVESPQKAVDRSRHRSSSLSERHDTVEDERVDGGIDPEFIDDDAYMFDDELAGVPVIPTRLMQSLRVEDISEDDVTRILDEYDMELQNRNVKGAIGVVSTNASDDHVGSTVEEPTIDVAGLQYDENVYRLSAVENENVNGEDDGAGVRVENEENDAVTVADREPVVFKRPYDVSRPPRRRVASGELDSDHYVLGASTAKRRRLFRDLRNDDDDDKENYSTSDDESEGEQVRPRKLLQRRASEDVDRFEVVDVEPVVPDTPIPNADQLPSNTVLLIYRAESLSAMVTRFTRVSAIAAAGSTPPIVLNEVSWSRDDLLEHLKRMFGEEVKWFGRSRCNTDGFRLRVSNRRYDNIPDLSLLVRRSSADGIRHSVRV